jgi:hypothetical protein
MFFFSKLFICLWSTQKTANKSPNKHRETLPYLFETAYATDLVRLFEVSRILEKRKKSVNL